MKWQSIPSWLIILVCSGLAAIRAIGLSSETVVIEDPTLTRLPALPEPAAAVYAIETEDYWEADSFIQAVNGQIYRLKLEEGDYIWQEVTPATPVETGEKCSINIVSTIEKSASSVVDCRVVATNSEWCPGPNVAFAIDEEGAVWRLTRIPPCFFFTVLPLIVFVPAGFVLGVALVGVRAVVQRLKSKQLEGGS